MARFNFIPKRILTGDYGALYNWYATQPQVRIKYGYLYNFHAVTDSRNIAASNAHMPTKAEWESSINGIDTYDSVNEYWPLAGKKLKETGLIHWNVPNISTNEVNFNLRGCGRRFDGVFEQIKEIAGLWCEDVPAIFQIYYDWEGCNFAQVGFDNSNGNSIRLIVDTPIEINDNSAIYVGNDGRRYKCIRIGFYWYLAENLAETKYRNGDLIPKFGANGINYTNSEWAALTTGAMCAYDNDDANAFDSASIAPEGWHVPSDTEWETLSTYLGGNAIAGGKLKQMGFDHWNTPNYGATNDFNFSAVGSGWRSHLGEYMALKQSCILRSSKNLTDTSLSRGLYSHIGDLDINYSVFNNGLSLRLIKDDSTDPGTLTDIDGNVYPTIKIGTQVWTTNWKCTKLNDSTPIPNITDNAGWAALSTMGMCYFNNDPLKA